jgi:hypothetical protein
MMPQHHHLSLACLRDGNGSGSGVRLCASTAATGQAMMPWHHHLYLAHLRNGNGNGGGRGSSHQPLFCKLININRKKTINAFIILIFTWRNRRLPSPPQINSSVSPSVRLSHMI